MVMFFLLAGVGFLLTPIWLVLREMDKYKKGVK